MRKSKYLHKEFDGGWVCLKVSVYRVQGKRLKGTKKPSKSAGHMNYCYTFGRKTSDGKFDKSVLLRYSEAAKVWKGEAKVDELADLHEVKLSPSDVGCVKYSFLDRRPA